MRYSPEHKAEVRRKIVEDASRRVRTQGLSGAAVATVMQDAGLTHGGFYKHFKSKDALLLESLRESFQQIADMLAQAAEGSRPETAWKTIVKLYLSPEHCNHPEWGCPVAALASELARAEKSMKPEILGDLKRYKSRILPFMPGRRAADKESAFIAIFSTMLGAIGIARILTDPKERANVLATAQKFLLHSF